jgi:hypothetical protein
VDIQASAPLFMKKWFMECHLPVCVLMVEQILFVFDLQEFIHHRSMRSECEHTDFKNRGTSKHKMSVFF